MSPYRIAASVVNPRSVITHIKIYVHNNVVLLDPLLVPELNIMGTVKKPHPADLEKEKNIQVVTTSGLPSSSLARQPLVGPGLPKKLCPFVSVEGDFLPILDP